MRFEDVYARYFQGVYRFLLSLCRDERMAEELTQRTFWKALKKYADFRGGCEVTTWLCAIARNEYLQALRSQKETPVERLPDAPGDASAEDALLRAERRQALHRLVHALPEPYREVFMLRAFGELDYQSIAALFQKGESWARVTFYRAKSKILEAYGREEHE